MWLPKIAEKIERQRNAVEAWFAKKEKEIEPALFLSCDIRHSGYKIAVVDANLFPAGFNNLCHTFAEAATEATRAAIESRFPGAGRALLLAESHTRNKFYIENLWQLAQILERAGLQVRIGMVATEFHSPLSLALDAEKAVTLYPIGDAELKNRRVHWPDFDPDIVISNNDFSIPLPDTWQGLLQPIAPLPALGWHRRRKSRHFALAQTLISEFATLVDIDPLRLTARAEIAEGIDLKNPDDVERLAHTADRLLQTLAEDYAARDIANTPYLFLKSDSGTYGMGILTASSAEEILAMNRKSRTKLLSSKGGTANVHFILQEGIPTDDFYSEHPIEPVIYAIGGTVVGGFFRINPTRDAYASLNAQGMEFSCLCLHKLDEPHELPFIQCRQKRDLVAVGSILTRLSALAAGLEARDV